jgi:hypothetical protein
MTNSDLIVAHRRHLALVSNLKREREQQDYPRTHVDVSGKEDAKLHELARALRGPSSDQCFPLTTKLASGVVTLLKYKPAAVMGANKT